MPRFCATRFAAQRRLLAQVSGITEINTVLETVRGSLKALVPRAMESCLLLLDPDAADYTRPLRCDLYDHPVSCIACKRKRPAVRRAMTARKAVVMRQGEPVQRRDGTQVETGAEAAVPIFGGRGETLAVISLLFPPGARATALEFLLLRDTAETAGHLLRMARNYWRVSQEKVHLGQELTRLHPFLPRAVREMVELGEAAAAGSRRPRRLSVLFVDIEGYTELAQRMEPAELAATVERVFSSFVDLIHRSGGDINETMGDGLMILFQQGDPARCAESAVTAAMDIHQAASRPGAGLAGVRGLKLNMGIASGEALVGARRFAGSSYTRSTFTATGAVTNLAARLSDLAGGGDILICEQTRRLLGESWPVYGRGESLLKGFAQPVRVFSPLPPPERKRTLPALGDEM